jgi:hypothetical protein
MTNETKASNPFVQPSPEEIATYAYHLWEADGHQEGRDVDYWLQAKAHLIADRQYEAGLLPARAPAQKSTSSQTTVAEENAAAKTNRKKAQRSNPSSPRPSAFA